MANPWFRLYAETIDDTKLLVLDESMRWRFVALLCARCKADDLTDRIVALRLRLSPKETQETKAVFIDSGFIDQDWKILKWDKRQYVSDNATARVQKFRASQKETFQKRYMKQDRNTPEADTDTEDRFSPFN